MTQLTGQKPLVPKTDVEQRLEEALAKVAEQAATIQKLTDELARKAIELETRQTETNASHPVQPAKDATVLKFLENGVSNLHEHLVRVYDAMVDSIRAPHTTSTFEYLGQHLERAYGTLTAPVKAPYVNSVFEYLPALLSSSFRLAVYVFLRVIPSHSVMIVLLVLYLSHLLFPGQSLGHLNGSQQHDNPQPSSRMHDHPIPISQPGTQSRTRYFQDILSTTMLSLPSKFYRLNLINLIINTLLLLAAADFALTPFLDTAEDVVFTRVGGVYRNSVKIAARYPRVDGAQLGSRIVWRECGSEDAWKIGPSFKFEADRDWVDTVRLAGLWPSTSYEYRISSLNGTLLPYPSKPIVFRTFPDSRLPSGTHFRFLVSSSIAPNSPYLGPFHRNSIRGFDLMADYIFPSSVPTESLPMRVLIAIVPKVFGARFDRPKQLRSSSAPTEFLLFLGDFIHAGVPSYAGDIRDAYRRLYRRNYQSRSFRKIYESIPIFHAYNDHENIKHNAADLDTANASHSIAYDGFKVYNSEANHDPAGRDQSFYNFRYGDVAFFVMDTRRYRSETSDERDVDTDTTSGTMLGDDQLASLHHWLSRVNGTSTFKFIISPVPFTSLWGDDSSSDSWAGFPSEKAALLDAFHFVPNVIILSGDRHEFAAVEFSTSAGHTVREFSTSPLSMFHTPFARSLRLQSDQVVRKMTGWTKPDVEDEDIEPEPIYDFVPKERVLKYIPRGKHKWSAFEIDTTDWEKPTLRLETVIDGKAKYHFDLVGTPVKLHSSSAVGAFLHGAMKFIVDRLGLYPGKWF